LGARALSVDLLFVPTDGTFRDAAALSRFERAALLAQRIGSLNERSLALREVAELRPELEALGVDIERASPSPRDWKVSRLSAAWDDSQWGKAGDWSWSRMTAVDAFWTDPSSPSLRYSMAAEPSGRPRIAPPRPDRVNFMAAWTPPAPRDDFTVSSIESILPANQAIALNPSLGVDFAFSPHTAVAVAEPPSPGLTRLPAGVTTLEALARVGLPVPQVDVPGSAPSPVMEPETPAALRTPMRLPRTPAAASTPSPAWRWRARYQSSGLFTGPATDFYLATDPSRSFLTGHDAIGAGSTWSHYTAGGGYPLPLRNLDVNVKFDEWTFGGPGLAGAPGANLRTFGLDRARLQDARLNINYNVDPSLTLQGGYIYTRTSGLYAAGLDPSVTNLNVTTDRAYPYLGVDYKISNDARWNLNIRFYNTPLDVTTSGPPKAPLNLSDPQVTTEFKVRF
jgi:hypothetical protein